MPSTGHLPGAFLFKLDRTRVSERRVATLGIINVFDEARQRGNDVVESLVLHQVNLFDLECLHEALGLGVVVWVAASTHRTVEAVLGELGAVVFGSVLRTAVGVMDATCWRSARRDGGPECGKRQTRIDPPADRIANNSPGPGVQDRSEINETGRDRDIGVSRPKGFHLRPLSEPDVNLAAHPAPIIHPTTDSPSTNGPMRRAEVAPAV